MTQPFPRSVRGDFQADFIGGRIVGTLTQLHRDHLLHEGFSESHIDLLISQYGVRSLTQAEALAMQFKVWDGQQWQSSSGILFPFTKDFAQLRCDTPVIRANNKTAKYITQSGKPSQAFLPEGCKVITEGFKDAMAGTLHGGIPTGAIAGVSHYRKALPQGCGYTIIFDADGWTNPQVFANLIKAGLWCKGKVLILPAIQGEPKGGISEYVKAGGDFKALFETALTPQELLEEWPKHWAGLPSWEVVKLAKKAAKLAPLVMPPDEAKAFNRRLKELHKGTGLTVSILDDAGKGAQGNKGELSAYQEDYYAIKKALDGRIRFNEALKRIEIDGKPFSIDKVRPFLAIDSGLTLDTGKEGLVEIVTKLALDNSFNPITDYLESVYERFIGNPAQLQDIGTTLAETYLKTQDSTDNVLLRKTLIAAIARAFDPGCKVDTSTVLVGGQGHNKSRFWKAIASEKYFCDDFSDPGNKDHLLKLHETWLVEWSELHGLSRREVTHVKAFMACGRDLIRVPYGRANEWMLRPSIIVGTSNESDFLTDSTGNRRWWIIECPNKIDVDAVERDRDLIWAAAMYFYKAGEAWWTDETLEKTLETERQRFQKRDVWHDQIASYVEGKARISIGEIFDRVLDVETGRRNNADQGRVAKVLKLEGYSTLPSPVAYSYKDSTGCLVEKKQRVWEKAEPYIASVSIPRESVVLEVPAVPEDYNHDPERISTGTLTATGGVPEPNLGTLLGATGTPSDIEDVPLKSVSAKGIQPTGTPRTPGTLNSLVVIKHEHTLTLEEPLDEF